MAVSNRRRNTVIVLILLILLVVALLLLLKRCPQKRPGVAAREGAPAPAPVTPSPGAAGPAAEAPPAEAMTPATLAAPERVTAGAAFSVGWTGPDNRGDFVTIVRADAAPAAFGSHLGTERGASLELTAPIEPGTYEVRYVTGRSHTILGRAPIEVTPAGATLDAPAEVVLGSVFSVAWTGPDNKGDYVTIVPGGAPDEHYGSYTDTAKGSPLTLTAPTETGDAEVRYVAGQGRKVLARRPIKVIAAEVSLAAPAEAVAGTTIDVTWTGPNNAGDYITVVAREIPDGQYGNYTNTASGSPLKLLLPIMDGGAELRYMTGQGGRVLARRPIRITAAAISLSAPAECAPGADVSITWTGPNNPGDYITIVAKGRPDGQYGAYTNTSAGSPLSVRAPGEAGEAEIRYASGQGNKVLARIVIKVVP
ncbi:MAG: hypothetical protein ACKVU4_08190 [Phycisphaerales bacterium]